MSSKTALITGASAGLGRATAIGLAELGYQLVLFARREEKLIELKQQLHVPTHIVVCDVTDQAAVSDALESLPIEFQNIDVLINNAGLALGLETSDKTDWSDWQTMIDTNVTALAYLTRLLLPRMVARNSGTIINLGSTAGHYAYKGSNMYGATKAFVDHFTISLRADLLGTKIRVTNLIPGLIGETEFSNIRFHGDQSAFEGLYENCQALSPQDIAESIRWIVSLPEHVNINRLEIMPTCQAPAGLALHKET
jgi:3-hydroxy acid dehydrogenase/malonic semialdehyde reductase